jgi:hypothetical protein
MDKPKIFNIGFRDLKITSKLLEDLMGYSDHAENIGIVSESISEILNIGESLFDIRCGYLITDSILLDEENNRLLSHGQWFNTNKTLTRQLRKSEKAAWFVCTAGDNISHYSRELMENGSLVKGYVVDVLANAAIEAAMDKIQLYLKSELLKAGLKITNRYSPGFCDWDISEQKKLFEVFPKGFLDIELTDSCLMIPMKSISGIIGIGAEVSYNEYSCNLCNDLNCMYRNKRKVVG